jgi:hypothetical protein
VILSIDTKYTSILVTLNWPVLEATTITRAPLGVLRKIGSRLFVTFLTAK